MAHAIPKTRESSNPNHEIISLMDRILHAKAVEGDIEAFKQHKEHPLDQLLLANKDTILHIFIAARSKHNQTSLNFVKDILERCRHMLWRVNDKDETLFHIAARHGHDDILKLLIEKSKDTQFNDQEMGLQMLKMTSKSQDTPLHEAVRFEHIEVVKLLVNETVKELHIINSAGETPFYLAVERGYKGIANEMKDSAKRFQAFDGPNGRTALHAAILRRDLGLTKLMLELGKDLIKKSDDKGWTPFHYAASICHKQIVEEILSVDDSAAYVLTADENKKTSLHLVADNEKDIANKIETMKYLISRCPGCAPLADARNWNFLHFALAKTDVKALRLVRENAWLSHPVNEYNKDGKTPLHLLLDFESTPHLEKDIFTELFKKYKIQSDPKVDLYAFDGQNRDILDIISQKPDDFNSPWDDLCRSIAKIFFSNKGVKMNQRVQTKPEVSKKNGSTSTSSVKEKAEDKEMRTADKKRERLLVAAVLIATVSFQAGLTVPGGFKTDCPYEGTSLLIKNAAFQVFVVTNSLAILCASLAIVVHLAQLMSVPWKYMSIISFNCMAICTVMAVAFEAVAFITGSYAILASNTKLAISILLILAIPMTVVLLINVPDLVFFALWLVNSRVEKLMFSTKGSGDLGK